MPEFDGYAPGRPCWIDLASADLDAAKTFYGALFGWAAETEADPAAGGYTRFNLGGRDVAGLGPLRGGPPAWASYIATDDPEGVRDRVEAAGGKTLMPPMTVLTAGRMAVFTDPGGAPFGVWQAGDHLGARIANEPDTWCLSELQSRDLEAAKRFYAAVFGWSIGAGGYAEVRLGDDFVAGMMPMPEAVPAEVGDHWTVYFRVNRCEETLERLQQLAGTVIREPFAAGPGRVAVAADPEGAHFHLMEWRG